MVMDLITSNIATIFVVIGLLAAIVSVITEVTKGIAVLAKIPTDIHVIVLSLSLSLIAYFAYISYTGTTIVWYSVTGTVIGSFIVAYVVMYGWDKLAILYKKFRNIPIITEAMIDTTTITTTNEAQGPSSEIKEA